MRQVAERISERAGCIVGGHAIWNIRYADDTTLLASNKEDLQRMAEAIREESLKYGLEINNSKTNTMCIHGEGDLSIQNQVIEKVNSFKFLGSRVNTTGGSSEDIKTRIAMAKSTTTSMTDIWKSNDLSTNLKVHLVKSLIWPIALYACESWTLKKDDERRLMAFETWVWRRLLRVSWKERRTNEWVRRRVNIPEDKGILAEVKRRKIAKYNHWKRRGNSMVTSIIEGKVKGKNRRGRRRIGWFDNIPSWTGRGLHAIHEAARNREMPTVLQRTRAQDLT